MKRLFFRWFKQNRLYLLAGTLLWMIIAGASWQYARNSGKPYLPTMVTWDEWAVAVLLLPRLGTVFLKALNQMTRSSRMSTAVQNVMYGGRTEAVVREVHEDLAANANSAKAGWVSRLDAVTATTFVLDLLIRGVFGLGWQPFI